MHSFAKHWLLLMLPMLIGCFTLQANEIEGLQGSFFGEAVTVSRNGAVIGAPGGTGDGSDLGGRVYVFDQSSDEWKQIAIFKDKSRELKIGHDYFGASVACTENRVVVGAWGKNKVASASGAAYVFERSSTGWQEVAELVNPDAGERHLLGKSVAVDGNTVVVGAPGANRNIGMPLASRNKSGQPKIYRAWSGNVYIWTREKTGWKYQTKLTPDATRMAQESWAGNVYYWAKGKTGWQYQTMLTPEDIRLGHEPATPPHKFNYLAEFFGDKVALQNDVLVVGASEGTATPGKVFIFRKDAHNTWTQEARLEQSFDGFGRSIAISNGTVVVGAEGTVFVYTYTNDDWRLQAKVGPHINGKESGFQYGGPVAIDGDLMVIGAMHYKHRKGAVFVFVRVGDVWNQVALLTAKDTKSDRLFSGAIGDLFGRSVAVVGDTIVIGANYHDSEGPNNGAAYVFKRKNGKRWLQTSKLVARMSPIQREQGLR